VVFQALGPAHIRHIALKELEAAKLREGFTKRGLELTFTPRVLDYLTEIGFHEKYGARPLQRALEDFILRPLADWLLEHPGVSDKKLEVDFEGKVLVNGLL